MMRYRPPKGTAGLALSAVSGCRREPIPPARMMPIVFSSMRAFDQAYNKAKIGGFGPRFKSFSGKGAIGTFFDTGNGVGAVHRSDQRYGSRSKRGRPARGPRSKRLRRRPNFFRRSTSKQAA